MREVFPGPFGRHVVQWVPYAFHYDCLFTQLSRSAFLLRTTLQEDVVPR